MVIEDKKNFSFAIHKKMVSEDMKENGKKSQIYRNCYCCGKDTIRKKRMVEKKSQVYITCYCWGE